jgi:hypothetical protein
MDGKIIMKKYPTKKTLCWYDGKHQYIYLLSHERKFMAQWARTERKYRKVTLREIHRRIAERYA